MKTTKTKKNPASKDSDQNEENKTPGYSENEVQDGLGSEREVETDDNDLGRNGRSKNEADDGLGSEEDIDTDDSDLTGDDLDALGPEDLSMDGGDDADLAARKFPVDFSGEFLDVPGSELDDDDEDIGSEDEENNFYSHGDTQ